MEFPAELSNDLEPTRHPVPNAALDGTPSDAQFSPGTYAAQEALAPPADTDTGSNTPLDSVGDDSNQEPSREQPGSSEPVDAQPPEPTGGAGGTGDEPPTRPPVDRGATDPGDADPQPAIAVYRDAVGHTAAFEYRYTAPSGAEVSRIQPYDSAGNPLSIPGLGSSLALTGTDAFGVTRAVAERDEAGRPTRVVGTGTDGGYVASVQEAVTGTSSSSDHTHSSELVFTYGDTGLLEKLEETEVRSGGLVKRIHTNHFNDAGERVGFTRQELVDVNTQTGAETYTTTILATYERGDHSWRETVYEGFRDGLIPTRVAEDTRTRVDQRPFVPAQTIYEAPRYRADQQVYATGTQEDSVTLSVVENGFPDPNRTIQLRSWIPQTAATDVATQQRTLAEAATMPDFPEVTRTQVMTRGNAVRNLTGPIRNQTVINFLNDLRSRDTVVLQPLQAEPAVLADIDRRTDPDAATRPVSNPQKLAVLGAIHPAFSRTDVVPSTVIGRELDRRTLTSLLRLLHTTQEEMTEAAVLLSGALTDDARRALNYLLPPPQQ